MSVAILLVTHNNIASSMMEIASSVVNDTPVNYAYVEIPMDAPVDDMATEIETRINQLDTSNGLLVITDMYGGTPSNIAKQFTTGENTRMISGLNLPMLIRTMNYRDLPLSELTEKIAAGGQQSIKLHEDT